MPYLFQPGEDLGPAIVRIGLEQIDRARTSLKQAEPGKAVHETRKCIKRLRALLRLVRSGIGDAAFTRENHRLRDISRALSAERDRVVLAETLARLAPATPAARRLARSLATPADASTELATRRLVKTAQVDLADARKAWEALDPGPNALDAVVTGLERGLRDLRDNAALAADGADEAVHDWRKAVQRHWRHMRLLEAGWPTYFQSRMAEAKTVSELLGRSQDLSLLVHWLDSGPQGLTADEAASLRTAAQSAQDEARQQARARCLRLTADGPKPFARRAVAHWTTAGDIAPLATPAVAHLIEGPPVRRSKAGPASKKRSAHKREKPRGARKSAR